MKAKGLGEQLLFTTLRLEAETPDGVSVGTGFIVEHEFAREKKGDFLVTARHVVRDATRVRFFLHRRGSDDKPLLGDPYVVVLEEFEKRWTPHPSDKVDVAVMPFAPVRRELKNRDLKSFYRPIPDRLIATDTQIEELDALEDLVFVGYPNGIYDTVNYLPIARRGTSASPIGVDFCGDPVFMMDASVFPGSSGSPVFLGRPAGPDGERDLLFLGLVARVAIREDMGFLDEPTPTSPAVHVTESLDLAVVYKACTVYQTINAILAKRKPLENGEATAKAAGSQG